MGTPQDMAGACLYLASPLAAYVFGQTIAVDGGHPLLTPIVALHAFYRAVEATARGRGRDPDQPPHLKKVTETL